MIQVYYLHIGTLSTQFYTTSNNKDKDVIETLLDFSFIHLATFSATISETKDCKGNKLLQRKRKTTQTMRNDIEPINFFIQTFSSDYFIGKGMSQHY